MTPWQETPITERWRGLWKRQQEADVDPSFAREALNAELFGNVLKPRGGTHRLNGSAAAGRVHAIHNARFRDGTTQVILAAGTKLQKLFQGAVVSDPPTDLPLSLPAGPARGGGVPTVMSALNNQVFIANGADDNVKWDGTTVTRMGVSSPLAAPVVAVVAGPGLTGDFGYRTTYVSTYGQESEASPETLVTLVNQKGRVTVVASTDPQVNRTRLYRTTTNGGGVWLFVAEMLTNGGTFPDDSLDDDGLGSQLEEFVNDPPPGPFRIVAQWPQTGRMLGVSPAQPSVLYYSDIGLGFLKPEAWPPENLALVSYDDGDEIVGVHALFDSVIVQKRRSTWRIRGNPPDVEVEPIHFDEDRTGIGGFSHRTLVLVDNDLFMPGIDGSYSLSRWEGGGQEVGYKSARMTRAIDDLWATLSPTNTSRFHAVFSRSRRQFRIWVAIPPSTEPDLCLVFQLDATPDGQPNGWTEWTIPATASAIVQTVQGDRCYIGTVDGFVEETDQGHEDHWTGATPGNGQAYEFNYEWQPFCPTGESATNARMRRVDLLILATSRSILAITPLTEFTIEWPGVNLTVQPTATFLLDTDPASLPDAGILADLDADGNPIGGTVLGEATPVVYPCVYQALGRYHGLRIVNAERGADFAIHNAIYRWQPLPVKARTPAVVQQLM